MQFTARYKRQRMREILILSEIITNQTESSKLMIVCGFSIYMIMRNVKEAICVPVEIAERKKRKDCIDIPKRVVRGTSETKIKKNIRIMKAPIGLHVVPSPSYPGLHTHFASGSSC